MFRQTGTTEKNGLRGGIESGRTAGHTLSSRDKEQRELWRERQGGGQHCGWTRVHCGVGIREETGKFVFGLVNEMCAS